MNYNIRYFEETFHLRTLDGKYNLLADLLADENMCSIKVATFRGRTKTDYLKWNEYGFTCLLYAMDQVSEYCTALNDTYIDVSHYERKEKKMFDEDAFREAWINAVVHNRWIDKKPPAVYWYEDRMEIISYGTIPNGMTKEEFLAGKSSPVNDELMQIFLRCHIVEQTGHGVPKVVLKYGTDAYHFGTSMITVTIPFDKSGFNNWKRLKDKTQEGEADTKETKENTKENDANTKENDKTTQDKIIRLIKENPEITGKMIAVELSLTVDSVFYTINQLKKKKKIRHVGSTKSGHWEIIG